MRVCVSDVHFWYFPYSNLFFFRFFIGSVNSNGLWWWKRFPKMVFIGRLVPTQKFHAAFKSVFFWNLCLLTWVVMVICNGLFVVGWFAATELQAGVIWCYQLQSYLVTKVSDTECSTVASRSIQTLKNFFNMHECQFIFLTHCKKNSVLFNSTFSIDLH